MKPTTKATQVLSTRDYAPTDHSPIRDWVDFCVACANEAQQQLVKQAQKGEADIGAEHIEEAVREAYGAAMPLITDGSSARTYIACVAHGLAIGIFPGDLAGKMVYVAQTALSAIRSV